MLTVVESCRISPPPATVGNRSLPLTFFDNMFLLHFPINQLFFYEFPHSKPHFMQTIVSNLKQSLSITLQHFFPFTSNLIAFPSNHHSRKPEIRYVEGDSVRFTLAECDLDFKDLAGTKYDFLKAWTSIARHGTDGLLLADQALPVFDRLVQYPESLDKMFVNQPRVETLNLEYQPPELVGSSYKVRATFILIKEKINLIKKWIATELPALGYVSSFSIACAYVWSCIAKSRVEIENLKSQDELERFVCLANFRSRMDPPLPPTYFGNCVGPCVAISKSTLLAGNKGFLIAVESLGNQWRTQKFFYGVRNIFKNIRPLGI
ncbi:putative transferase [Helianthus anomalus]